LALEFSWERRASGREVGNFLGYGSATEAMREALRAAGGVESPEARVRVHFCFPEAYSPVAGRRNVLFTMFENPSDTRARDEIFKPALDASDLVVTPSRFCAEMFREWTDTPVEVCPLGIDPDRFPYRRRRWKPRTGEPFRWLYLGAPNHRKFTILWQLWTVQRRAWGPGVEIYLKHTGLDFQSVGTREAIQGFDVEWTPDGEILRAPGVTIDNRKVDHAELLRIYYSAHAFAFLHCGEGWGLSGQEAMATGLPVLVSDYSGTQEYATKNTAYLVECEHRRVELNGTPDDPDPPPYEGPWPVVGSAVDQAAEIQGDYRRATKIAKAGAEVAKALSWRAAGKRLYQLLSRL